MRGSLLAQSVDKIKDGNPTASLITAGAPTASITDLANTHDIRIAPLAGPEGNLLAAIGMISLLYARFGRTMPSVLAQRGHSVVRVVNHIYVGTEGIYGIAVGVVEASASCGGQVTPPVLGENVLRGRREERALAAA